MIYKLVLNFKNPLVKNDIKNIHGLHMIVCSMFEKGVLWRLKDNVLYVKSCVPRFISCSYVLSMVALQEYWNTEADFELTARPTKVIRDDDRKHGRRVPVDPLPWLERKATTSGFEVVCADIESRQTVRGFKLGHKMIFNRVDFKGKLRILDRTLFEQALNAGIGPSKGYGFGLLMTGGAGGVASW